MFCSQKLSAIKNALSLFRDAASGTLRQNVKGNFIFRDCQKYAQSSRIGPPPPSRGGCPHSLYLQVCTTCAGQNPQGRGLQLDIVSLVRTRLFAHLEWRLRKTTISAK